jgi:hypothetical protein
MEDHFIKENATKYFILTSYKTISLRRVPEKTSISLRAIPHVAVG